MAMVPTTFTVSGLCVELCGLLIFRMQVIVSLGLTTVARTVPVPMWATVVPVPSTMVLARAGPGDSAGPCTCRAGPVWLAMAGARAVAVPAPSATMMIPMRRSQLRPVYVLRGFTLPAFPTG